MNNKYDGTMMLQFAKDNMYSIIPLENEMNIDPTSLKLSYSSSISNVDYKYDRLYRQTY